MPCTLQNLLYTLQEYYIMEHIFIIIFPHVFDKTPMTCDVLDFIGNVTSSLDLCVFGGSIWYHIIKSNVCVDLCECVS